MKRLIPLTIVLFALAGGVVSADSKDNDRVLKGKDFTEVFKDDGNGKNYLVTHFLVDAPPPGKCIVITGDSEKTVAVACNLEHK